MLGHECVRSLVLVSLPMGTMNMTVLNKNQV